MKHLLALEGKRRGCINLDACARYYWNTDLGVPAPAVSPFAVDPMVCQDLVQANHTIRNLDWSWGGYFENRSTLWAGSYLSKTGKWLHLGVDCNVRAGTPVNVPRQARVVHIDNDYPELHGWGLRVVMKDEPSGLYIIYAHLLPQSSLKVGQVLHEGQIFAVVGAPENNGGWYPHLHIQAMTPSAWQHYRSNLSDLDGYGHPSQEQALRKQFPNPVVALDL